MKRATAFARLQHTHTQLRLNATVIMRILTTLFFLPVLIAVGACTQTVPSAIANDDRPSSPQPAIAPSAVPTPLTIESLSGTYKGVVDELELTNLFDKAKKQGLDEVTLKAIETHIRYIRQAIHQSEITIKADGTFESQFPSRTYRGNVKLDGNKLSFTTDPAKSIEDLNSTTKVRTLAFVASANGRILRRDKSKYSSELYGYIKQ